MESVPAPDALVNPLLVGVVIGVTVSSGTVTLVAATPPDISTLPTKIAFEPPLKSSKSPEGVVPVLSRVTSTFVFEDVDMDVPVDAGRMEALDPDDG